MFALVFQVDTRGCVLFTLDVCRLLSLEESDMSTDTQSHLLRLLVPVLKLYTAKKVCTCFLMCAPDTEACTNLYGTYIGCTILAHQASTSLYFQLHLWRNKTHPLPCTTYSSRNPCSRLYCSAPFNMQCMEFILFESGDSTLGSPYPSRLPRSSR